MALRDIHNQLTVKALFSPIDPGTGNTALVSNIIDTQGYDGLELVISIGTVADADVTFAFLLEDGDNSALSDNATVATAQVLGTTALGLEFDTDNKIYKLGYIGNHRYVRATITPANNTGSWPISGVAVLGRPHSLPAA